MHTLVVFAALIACSIAAPQVHRKTAAHRKAPAAAFYPGASPYYHEADAPYYHHAVATPYYQPAATPYYQSAAYPSSSYYQPAAPVYQPSYYSAPTPYKTAPYVGSTSTAYKPAAILRQSQDVQFDGSYNYDFESENGISVQSSGAVKPLGPEEGLHTASGSYSYTAPDGTPITTNWFADENGFHAEGAHLPVAPPIPQAILRSLEYQASQPQKPEYQQ